eukprot:TRINITY_DN14317_c0_g1_i1.p1 TRINITY_DN14317_c0_g1~~TRINITY_DN14317_c0_g1_i1.p1  ORF type:complete len:485 (+),score=-78.83 TRINITY_DN14317_c0_g1_i1:66-1520(+)
MRLRKSIIFLIAALTVALVWEVFGSQVYIVLKFHNAFRSLSFSEASFQPYGFVTLLTHVLAEDIYLIHALSQAWPGPIKAIVWSSSNSTQGFPVWTGLPQVLVVHQNYSTGAFCVRQKLWDLNYAHDVNTDYVFVSRSDIIPNNEAFYHFQHLASHGFEQSVNASGSVYIAPSFECSLKRNLSVVPTNVSELQSLVNVTGPKQFSQCRVFEYSRTLSSWHDWFLPIVFTTNQSTIIGVRDYVEWNMFASVAVLRNLSTISKRKFDNSADLKFFLSSQGIELRLLNASWFLLHSRVHSFNPLSTSIATHLSVERIPALLPMISNWNADVSVAFYVRSQEEYDKAHSSLQGFTNVIISTFWQQPFEVLDTIYPVNILRNVAVDQISTAAFVMLDVDFVPHPDLHRFLTVRLQETLSAPRNECFAWVIPAFIMGAGLGAGLPANPSAILSRSDVVPCYIRCPDCHLGTDYTRWFASNASFQLDMKTV